MTSTNPVPADIMIARRLDKQLRAAARTISRDVHKYVQIAQTAKAQQIHKTLGFKSWTAYVADVTAADISARLPLTDRRVLVKALAEEGMSERAIAAAVKTSQKTVDRDLKTDVSRPDSTVNPQFIEPGATITGRRTGLDNKSYPAQKPSRTSAHGSRLAGINSALLAAVRHADQWSERTDLTPAEAQALHRIVEMAITSLTKLEEHLNAFDQAVAAHPAGKQRTRTPHLTSA